MSTKYTATLKVVIPQLVHCMHCDSKFVYEMTVSGYETVESGLRYSERGAEAAAEKGAREHLDRQLNNPELCNAIPCRNCFRYQPYMYKLVAQQRYLGMGCVGFLGGSLGFLAAVGAVIAWFGLPNERPVILWIGAGGVALWLAGLVTIKWGRRLEARYDPNSDRLTYRRKIADERALTPEEFDLRQAARVRREYGEHAEAARNPRWTGKEFHGRGPLVVNWWVAPSVFVNGGSVSIPLSETDRRTVTVPDDADPGDEFDAPAVSPTGVPLKVRLHAFRVHPDEQRLE